LPRKVWTDIQFQVIEPRRIHIVPLGDESFRASLFEQRDDFRLERILSIGVEN
jgi:hypothetical protein